MHHESSPLLRHESSEARKQVLDVLDETALSWYHLKAVLVSGIGFFTDAYDLFIVNLAVPMIGMSYYDRFEDGKVPSSVDALIKGTAAVGTLLGQLLFGVLADRLGRKKIYGVELMIMVVGAIGCALSFNAFPGLSMVSMLCFWRLVLGFGIGGDYPVSAVITSEFAHAKHRGKMVAAVFAMQGLGILSAALVSMFVLVLFKRSIEEDPYTVDYVWRLIVGFGAIPALFTVYYRMTIPETPRFTMDVEGDLGRAVADTSRFTGQAIQFPNSPASSNALARPSPTRRNMLLEFREYFGQWRNFKVLLGCSLAWFSLDVAFYGLGLNTSVVLTSIGYSDKTTPYAMLHSLALGNALISMVGTVPGYWITVILIDKVGRKPIQILGFSMLTIILLILGVEYEALMANSIGLFIGLYIVGQLFFNFGPNTTTFVIPSEVFPTRFRSTGHGISAACGKLGAILATTTFGPLQDLGGKGKFIPKLMLVFSFFMFLGLLATFLIPETKDRSLESIVEDESKEDHERSKHVAV
ncbi:phosphate:H+ symporter [Basidiobolus meristosporus CBS 931.73]|uniref:Phosphate:H+ symporter n=1 Tax=Basidiobolus meristosporus CBS 931.73 TaxID=1314790 RepID=A0A1Y1WPM2_9FUNG|nr:phosphate:H+ symporter [Basidiobolus meristosporus CBS 931.73]|eukprot:ORX75487.1 phosphate:H+ symporter [Basidiobolus meristosporus CBS 931.73]